MQKEVCAQHDENVLLMEYMKNATHIYAYVYRVPECRSNINTRTKIFWLYREEQQFGIMCHEVRKQKLSVSGRDF